MYVIVIANLSLPIEHILATDLLNIVLTISPETPLMDIQKFLTIFLHK